MKKSIILLTIILSLLPALCFADSSEALTAIFSAESKYKLDTTAYNLTEYAVTFSNKGKTIQAANDIYSGASPTGFRGYRYFRDIDLYGNTLPYTITYACNNTEIHSNGSNHSLVSNDNTVIIPEGKYVELEADSKTETYLIAAKEVDGVKLYGLVDYSGNELTEFAYKYMDFQTPTLAKAQRGDEECLVSTNGTKLAYDSASVDEDGLIQVGIKGCFGYINSNFEVVIPTIFQSINKFYGRSYTTAVHEGKNVIIDKIGNIIAAPENSDVYFYNSYIEVINKTTNTSAIYDFSGNIIKTLDVNPICHNGCFYTKDNENVVLYNASGEEIIKGTVKTNQNYFDFPISAVFDKWSYKGDDDYMILHTVQGTALVDTETGRIIFNDAADKIGVNSSHNQYMIKSGKSLTVKRLSDNETLINLTNLYEEIQPFIYGIAKAKTENGYNFITAAGEKIFKYDLNDADVNDGGVFSIMLRATRLNTDGADCPYWERGSWAITRLTEPPICVKLNGEYLSLDVNPKIINGRTLVPVRAIFESLGAKILWDDVTQTVTALQGNTVISLSVNSSLMYINGESIPLDVAAAEYDDRVLVPVRAIAEALNCTVDWNDITNTVVITE